MTRIAPEDELILICVGTAARRADQAGRARELAARADWGRVLAAAWRQRLLPLAAERLEAMLHEPPPAPFVAAAAGALRTARGRALAGELATERAAAAIEAAGSRVLPLKGASLAAALYGDAGMRDSRDVDLLVAREDLGRAGEALRSIGYTAAADAEPRPVLHTRWISTAGLPDLELHWRVHWYEERFAADMLRAARAQPDGLRRATRADEWVSLLLFWARDGFSGLRLAADVAQWWDCYGSELPPDAVATAADRYPALRTALAVAARHAVRVAGVAAGGPARGAAPDHPAVRLADWRLARGDEEIHANIALADLLLAPRPDMARHARRQALPPQRIASARAGHAIRLGARWLVATWRIRRGRVLEPLPPWTRTGPTRRLRPTATG